MKIILYLQIQSESVVEQTILWIPTLCNFVHSSQSYLYQYVPYIKDNKRNAVRPPHKIEINPPKSDSSSEKQNKNHPYNERTQQLAYTVCNQTPCGTRPTLPTPQDPPKCIYHQTCVGSCVNYQTKEITHCIEPPIKNTINQCIFYFFNIQNP